MKTPFLLSLIFVFFFLSHLISTSRSPSNDKIHVAKDALSAGLTSAKSTGTYVSGLSYPANQRMENARSTYAKVLGNTVDSFSDSLNQMNKLDTSGTPSFQFQIINMLTWLSVALTNANTCIDGFKGVAVGLMKTDVSDRAHKVKKLTINALALANKLNTAP